jgi:molecular chaperone HscC
MIIGIDLGTTNSAVAYMGDDGPQLIPNALGETLTPSVVGIDDGGKLLVGRAARELQVLQPERCASVFKRRMGTDWSTEIAGRKFSPEELSSLVLRSLKEDAEAKLGAPVEKVVITVPAYFNEHQRKATINAGRIAGLQVERILNEPTAAAIAYGFHELKDDKTLVVLDLGGGTFDVSVVELFEGVLEVKASSGENFLGGEDFSRTVAAKVAGRFGKHYERLEFESPKCVSRLLQFCERAKCKLSRENTATVRWVDHDGNPSADGAEVTVTREEFEAWTEPLVGRIEQPLRRALTDAGLRPDQVDEVLLVGGATRMPRFVGRVKEIFGKPPQCRLNPDEVVARGAAVQTGLIRRNVAVGDMMVTDVAPFTLGVELSKEFGNELRAGFFLPILHRNTTIPASRVERVYTVRMNQPLVSVKIFQGESRHVAENLPLGEFEVRNIPPGPSGQAIDLRFTYDLNGVLEVEATVVATGQKFTHVVTRNARGLSADEVKRSLAGMQALKMHPREDRNNRYLLKRAERLYQEVPPLDRERLDRMIYEFEQALETGDKRLVDECRETLRGYLELFDAGDPSSDDTGGSYGDGE